VTRKFDVDVDDCCCCYGDDDCPACHGSGWVYETSTTCDYCGERVVLLTSPTPVWSVPMSMVDDVRCDDCERAP
jgi:hypothetical protein